jgi:muramoyltetrapeptide carboxypeptidase
VTGAVIPPRVARGAVVGVCAPAGPVDPERLRHGLDRLAQDFTLRVAPSLTAPREPDVPAYLAASDATRARELAALLADRDVRAIIVARGGYGVMRILPILDPIALVHDPKPIVGFSDMTALLAWVYAAGVRPIHGPMVAQLGELPEADAAALVEMLTVAKPAGVRPWPLVAHGTGTHRGHAVPANLTMASVLAATPWPLPLAGGIALVEEVGERSYEIDRYVTALRLAGALDRVAAVVVGDLTRCGDGADASTGMTAMLDRLAPIPVAVGAPIGHGARNEPVPFGARCTLDLDARTFSIDEPAVA